MAVLHPQKCVQLLLTIPLISCCSIRRMNTSNIFCRPLRVKIHFANGMFSTRNSPLMLTRRMLPSCPLVRLCLKCLKKVVNKKVEMQQLLLTEATKPNRNEFKLTQYQKIVVIFEFSEDTHQIRHLTNY